MKLFLIFLLVIHINKSEQASKLFNQAVDSQYSNGGNWSPSGVPTALDTASISTNNTMCQTSTNITVTGIVVGSSVSAIKSTFIVSSGIITLSFTVNKLSNVIFDIEPLNQPILVNNSFSITGNIINNKQFQFYTYSNLLISNGGTFTNNQGGNCSIIGSTDVNGGVFSNLGDFISYGNMAVSGNGIFENLDLGQFQSISVAVNSNGLLKNQGLFQILSTKISGGRFVIEDSRKNSSFISEFTMEGGELLSNNSQFITTVKNFNSTVNSNLINIINNSTWGYGYLNFTKDVDFATFTLSNTNLTSEDSSIILLGVESNFKTNSNISLSNSLYTTSYNIFIDNNSNFILESSQCLVNGSLRILSNSKVSLKNSTILLQENFLMANQSRFYGVNATFYILYLDSNATNRFGLVNNAQMIMKDRSDLAMFGAFYSLDTSSIEINNKSLLRIEKLLLLGNESTITLDQESQMEIYGSMQLYNSGSLEIKNKSIVGVHGSVILNDQSRFSLVESTLHSNLLFHLNTTGVESSANGSIITVLNGEFQSSGTLFLLNSYIYSYAKFLSEKEITLELSQILIFSGGCTIKNQFSGESSGITINEGKFIIDDNTEFNCNNCTIKIIKEGSFHQGLNSVINVTNTLFINNGIISSNSNILLLESSISNNGSFTLQSSIFSRNDTGGDLYTHLIKNTGQFIINGNETSNITVGFNNLGIITIQQDTLILAYQQNNGTLGLSNGKTFSSINVIQINGGSIQGKGQIITIHLNNTGGTVGGKSVDNITIHGNYTQTQQGTVVINLDENEDSTLINITSSAELGGTLVIRIEESQSDKELSKEVMTFDQSNGDFNDVVIKTYNKETGEETIQPPCKVSTQKSSKGLKILINPDPENCDPPSKSKLNKPLVIGLTVGIIGAALVIITAFLIKNRTTTKIIVQKARDKLKLLKQSK